MSVVASETISRGAYPYARSSRNNDFARISTLRARSLGGGFQTETLVWVRRIQSSISYLSAARGENGSAS